MSYRFPASISISPLLPQGSYSQHQHQPPLAQRHNVPTTEFPLELKQLLRYARLTDPQVRTVDSLKAWFDQQLHLNVVLVDAYLNMPDSAFRTDDSPASLLVSPSPATWRTPDRRRTTTILDDGTMPRVRSGGFRRASTRLQLSTGRRSTSLNSVKVAPTAATRLPEPRRPSFLDQSDLLPLAAMAPLELGKPDIPPPLLPMPSVQVNLQANEDMKLPVALLPPVVSSDDQQQQLGPSPSQTFGIRLMSRLAIKKTQSNHGAMEEKHNVPSGPPSVAPAPAKPGDTYDDVADDPIYYQENNAHVMSTLEVKQILLAERFSTPGQRDNDRFYRVGRFVQIAMNLVSLVMIFFTAFSLAARVGGTSHHVPAELCWIELALDVVSFLFVIIVNLWIPYEDGGHVVFDAKAIALRYLRDPTLAFFDVVSNFPALVVLAPLGLQNFEYARVNLLLREIKLPRVLDTLEELLLPPTMHPSLVRLGKYFLYLVLIITHLSTVFMLVLRYESEHAVEAWMEMSLDSLEHDPVYWFLRCWREMLSAIAEKRLSYPHEDVEYIAGLILLIFALATIAVILASFEEIIVTEIDSGNQLTAKIEATIAALEHRGLPDEFQEEVAEYYERMWEINRTFDFEVADDVLAELPDGLHADVEFECNARIIRTIPLFGLVATNPRFVRLLVGQLRQIVIMPGAPIVQKGEDGDCMFFLSSGDAAVMNEEGDQELVTLGVGAFFGEVTMLFGGTRDRDIIAKTVCVCAVITAEHFEQVLQEYPEALEGILNVAVSRAREKLQRLGASSEAAAIIAAFDAAGDTNPTHNPAATPSPTLDDDSVFRDIFAEQIRRDSSRLVVDAGVPATRAAEVLPPLDLHDAMRRFSLAATDGTREGLGALLEETCLVEHHHHGSLQLGRRRATTTTASFAVAVGAS